MHAFVVFEEVIFLLEDDAELVSEAVNRGGGHCEGVGELGWLRDRGYGVGREGPDGDMDCDLVLLTCFTGWALRRDGMFIHCY